MQLKRSLEAGLHSYIMVLHHFHVWEYSIYENDWLERIALVKWLLFVIELYFL